MKRGKFLDEWRNDVSYLISYDPDEHGGFYIAISDDINEDFSSVIADEQEQFFAIALYLGDDNPDRNVSILRRGEPVFHVNCEQALTVARALIRAVAAGRDGLKEGLVDAR